MRGRTSGGRAAAIAAALLAWARVTAAQSASAPMDPGVTFSAEVTVTQSIVDRSGKTTRELPASRYRLERLDGGGLRTTMLATRPRPAHGALADTYAGITVDVEPSTGALRVRDPNGVALHGPPPASVPAPPADDDAGLLVAPSDRAKRLAALAQQFGRPIGTVRALQRYLARRGRIVEEMLVAPDTAVPVELNRLEDGILVEHHAFEYAPAGDGRLVRVRARSESSFAQAQGTRLISLTTLSAVRVKGGAQ